MPQQLHKRVMTAVLLPIPLALALSGLFVWQAQKTSEDSNWVEHTSHVISQAELALRLVVEQETGVRGYLLTGDPAFLEPYERGKAQFPVVVAKLKALITGDTVQRDRIVALEARYHAWLADAETEHLDAQQRSEPAGRNNQISSNVQRRKPMMEAVRTTAVAIIDDERALLSDRRQHSDNTERAMMISGSAVLIIVGFLLVWFMRRLVHKINSTYALALRERTASEAKAVQARTAAEALAEEIAERGREMEKSFVAVREQRDAAVRRLAESERAS